MAILDFLRNRVPGYTGVEGTPRHAQWLLERLKDSVRADPSRRLTLPEVRLVMREGGLFWRASHLTASPDLVDVLSPFSVAAVTDPRTRDDVAEAFAAGFGSFEMVLPEHGDGTVAVQRLQEPYRFTPPTALATRLLAHGWQRHSWRRTELRVWVRTKALV